ncbi:hypothetical protein THF1C08_320094 [Vibrio jasicida]|uniref:Transposase n=1 Tax=Vibrio jasicida TaxID=766224 RepID=A0AAU9QPA8_9VIBR|nr:hypothetical protein THF1C08_320094 [Vibrio jasicida]CAH1597543.1 hypothetical protein THF1A12_320094 [Vibrio jasicida]
MHEARYTNNMLTEAATLNLLSILGFIRALQSIKTLNNVSY